MPRRAIVGGKMNTRTSGFYAIRPGEIPGRAHTADQMNIGAARRAQLRGQQRKDRDAQPARDEDG